MVLGKLATVANWTLARDYIPKIQQVTAEDIRRVARQYFVQENRTIGVLLPIKSSRPKVSNYQPAAIMH
jgi:predicted Zn-dependent peptidase